MLQSPIDEFLRSFEDREAEALVVGIDGEDALVLKRRRFHDCGAGDNACWLPMDRSNWSFRAIAASGGRPSSFRASTCARLAIFALDFCNTPANNSRTGSPKSGSYAQT